MWLTETKKIIIPALFLLAALFFMPQGSIGQDSSSASYIINDPVIDSGFQASSSLNFGLGQSLSQVAIGKSTSASFQLWSGFQYYFEVDANTLSATAGDGEVDLSWTVPTTYLGAGVAGYEVGTGTVSGTYTFEDAGNVTNFTKSGLTNGTTYYFITKAYGLGSTFLVYSNEATATPAGGAASSGGGSSGSVIGGSIVLSGTAYPDAAVTVLRDSTIIRQVTADSSGYFSVTLVNQPSGTYTYGIYATDRDGYTSPNVGVERTISTSVQSTVSGVLVGPTLRQSLAAVRQGDVILLDGFTAPGATVTLQISGSQTQAFTLNANTQGYYSLSLDTDNWPKGTYAAHSQANVSGIATPDSRTISFGIGETSVAPPDPGECGGRSDLNCDGRVNLVDFSILLYFWDLTEFSRNPRVDIDRSGDVDLRDLSIMLYDWNG